MTRAPACFLLGSDTLLIECGEILLEAGFDVRGVLSRDGRIGDWAKRRELPVFSPDFTEGSECSEALQSEPFDYLFSIANLSMVPEWILGLPRKRAINFHDGPLPRYAGIHAPAWAILHGETRYGITWHEMTAAADEGDILAQAHFDISPEETSLSLNTKCFQAAIDSFRVLAPELAAGIERMRTQDLSHRSYFGRHARPDRACTLDFSAPASELSARVRALHFGRYPNSLGLPTIRHRGHLLGVTGAEAREAEEADPETTPGTVVVASTDEVVVATGAGVIALRGFVHPCGTPLTVADACARLALEPGARITPLSEATAERLTALAEPLSQAEPFWVRRLRRIDPLEVPYACASRGTAGSGEVRVEVPPEFGERFAGDADALVAAIGAYLARLGDKDDFDVSFRERGGARDDDEAAPDLEAWLATHALMRMHCDADRSFAAFRASTAEELARLRERPTWLRDLIGRMPELRGRRHLVGCVLPVALEVGDTAGGAELAEGSVVTFSVSANAAACVLMHDGRLPMESAARMADQLERFLAWVADNEDAPLSAFSLLGEVERERVLTQWNDTAVSVAREQCVHQLFEAQVDRAPDAIAVVHELESVSYRELDERANRLAQRLRELGAGPDRLVAICMERSIDLVVGILGILKAGSAYVPLDPGYPRARVEFMLDDSQAPILLTEASLATGLPKSGARVLCIDRDWHEIATRSPDRVAGAVSPSDLAYVIYTSGSTGKPKGVMVEHRNVVSFFAGMDERVEHDAGSTWLAVTSLSFDISVLELFWTLARGFRVVVSSGADAIGSPATGPARNDRTERGMKLGMFFWGNDDGPGPQKYRLLLECAKFADEQGFSSVWTPERHFHAFGGPYPNAATISAAIAVATSRIDIRSGCVVLPLHHPIRVAEEWAVVDNLSDGRVGIGVAAGWMPNDFVIRPESYDDKKKVMLEGVETLRKLWRGDPVPFRNGKGELTETVTLPRPVQPEVPIWITTAGNPESYEQAGEAGAHLLTHLLGQTVEEVAEKIALYRAARAKAGFDPETGVVTLMLHTFVGDDDEEVRELVRGPMKSYLGSAVSLVAKYAWTFPTYQRPGEQTEDELDKLTEDDIASLTADEADTILEHAFERYFETSGLFGTPERCLGMIDRLKAIGVDEVGCLMDYGVPTDRVLESLPQLNRLRELVSAPPSTTEGASGPALPELMQRHRVTHLQCTPSLAQMLTATEAGREAIRPLRQMMVGGEALPTALAGELRELAVGEVTNMYGPTETTIWSSTASLDREPGSVPIGRPIANTRMYVLDRRRQPVPIGCPGEIHIGGDGVVRGYLGRSELTAERFVADPFGTPGERLYRTGDLGRWREDGNLEFLGRADFQVKIRGHRVELGEIEEVLGRQPSVRECVVTAREDVPGDSRLVAYLVAGDTTPVASDLRANLHAELPEHMVPSHFTILGELPLTPNGKVDRSALPAPDKSDQRAEVAYAPPGDALEASIAALWEETLGIPRVGLDENFFDIGGHSLLVVRVHRRLAEELPQALSLTDLYRFPTVRSLAAFLRDEDDGAAAQSGSDRAAKRRAAQGRKRGVRS